MNRLEYELGTANRLGNRSNNQDRWGIFEHGDAVLLVVADGMGGHRGGELAAQEAVDTIRELFLGMHTPIPKPDEFLFHALGKAHDHIARLGADQDPPYYPRTTCVACLVQENQAWWAHIGDSRLYLLRGDRVEVRTRDHSFIEELYQHDVITEEEMLSHPMRNYVSYCLGGPNYTPPISVSEATPIQENDIILLCTDGLWGAVNVEDLLKLKGIQLDTAINRLAEHAEQSSYPHSDNITAVAIRFLPGKEPIKEAENKPGAKGDLTQAIQAIRSALKDYDQELK